MCLVSVNLCASVTQPQSVAATSLGIATQEEKESSVLASKSDESADEQDAQSRVRKLEKAGELLPFGNNSSVFQ